jgi:hypothetical protein
MRISPMRFVSHDVPHEKVSQGDISHEEISHEDVSHEYVVHEDVIPCGCYPMGLAGPCSLIVVEGEAKSGLAVYSSRSRKKLLSILLK